MSFRNIPLLYDGELRLNQSTLLLGKNGSGKSTILKLVDVALNNRSFVEGKFPFSNESVVTLDYRISLAENTPMDAMWEAFFELVQASPRRHDNTDLRDALSTFTKKSEKEFLQDFPADEPFVEFFDPLRPSSPRNLAGSPERLLAKLMVEWWTQEEDPSFSRTYCLGSPGLKRLNPDIIKSESSVNNLENLLVELFTSSSEFFLRRCVVADGRFVKNSWALYWSGRLSGLPQMFADAFVSKLPHRQFAPSESCEGDVWFDWNIRILDQESDPNDETIEIPFLACRGSIIDVDSDAEAISSILTSRSTSAQSISNAVQDIERVISYWLNRTAVRYARGEIGVIPMKTSANYLNWDSLVEQCEQNPYFREWDDDAGVRESAKLDGFNSRFIEGIQIATNLIENFINFHLRTNGQRTTVASISDSTNEGKFSVLYSLAIGFQFRLGDVPFADLSEGEKRWAGLFLQKAGVALANALWTHDHDSFGEDLPFFESVRDQMTRSSLKIDEDSIIIVDEPELHLHPKLVLDYCGVLKEISDASYGLLIATHEIRVVNELKDIANIVIHNEHKVTEGGLRYELKAVSELDQPLQSFLLEQLGYSQFESFQESAGVILVEGLHEKIFLEQWFGLEKRHGFAIISCQGAEGIRAALEADTWWRLGRPVFAIFDRPSNKTRDLFRKNVRMQVKDGKIPDNHVIELNEKDLLNYISDEAWIQIMKRRHDGFSWNNEVGKLLKGTSIGRDVKTQMRQNFEMEDFIHDVEVMKRLADYTIRECRFQKDIVLIKKFEELKSKIDHITSQI
jgi:ABC-type ATPase involved in cell division